MLRDVRSSWQAGVTWRQVPEEEVASWRPREVYCGASVVSVCRGMRQAQVARLFGAGLLCVRAYDPITGGQMSSAEACYIPFSSAVSCMPAWLLRQPRRLNKQEECCLHA